VKPQSLGQGGAPTVKDAIAIERCNGVIYLYCIYTIELSPSTSTVVVYKYLRSTQYEHSLLASSRAT
jgi:hypothetical protein